MERKTRSSWIFYILLIALFCGGVWFLFSNGERLNPNVLASSHSKSVDSWDNFLEIITENLAEPAAMLLLQLLAILLVARIFGWFFGKIGQPTVIGEIIAGIMLGPSILGKFAPELFSTIFNPKSLGNLNILSQLGLVLFMFTIGMDLNFKKFKEKFSETWIISHASILIPFFGGMVLAYFLYDEFVHGSTSFSNFALFMGISMSITAFPVLARIIQERGQTRTHLGTMSLGSAAIGDVTAWCLLATIIAVTKTGSLAGSVYTLAFSVLYVVFMLRVVKPFLHRIGQIHGSAEVLNKSIVAFFLLVLVMSSLLTQIIGIHALFGAFLAGVIMPPMQGFRKLMIEKIEDVSVTLLLPLFFVFTGLRTEIGLLNTAHLWFTCGLICLVAILGKFGGTAISAAILGENTRNSLSMGILMNTRGLMELIVLNIGYELGVLPPTIFVMLVLMALFTTFLTSPALSVIDWLYPIRNIEAEKSRQKALGIFKALVACGNPENGKNLLNVAKSVLDGSKNSLAVTVMHLTVGTDLHPVHGEMYSEESFKGVRQEAGKLNIPIETRYKVTDNISHEIVHTVNVEGYDFLLVGAGVALPGRSLFRKDFFYPGSLIKDKTRTFIENSKCSVGVFVNRNFTRMTKTLVVLENQEDAFLLKYARRLLKNNGEVTVRLMVAPELLEDNSEIAQSVQQLRVDFPTVVRMAKSQTLNSSSVSGYSLMLISYGAWNLHILTNEKDLEYIPSTLIINKKTSRFHANDSSSD